VWGATFFRIAFPSGVRYFNSRSRVGSDPLKTMSIMVFMYFNSRSRVGSDLLRAKRGRSLEYFNSRSRVGSDLRKFPHCQGWKHFNSRSRVGSDGKTNARVKWVNISIHAPVWGATDGDAAIVNVGIEFQFTLPCGERLLWHDLAVSV
jgi:hypothetical protein